MDTERNETAVPDTGAGVSYIGISESKLHHILGVARKAYKIAKEMGKDETFARKCFLLGWLHDVGYEFSVTPEQHTEVGAEMFLRLLGSSAMAEERHGVACEAICGHGNYTAGMTDEHRILSMADMLVDVNGEEVDVMTRLKGIREWYGEQSRQYKNVCDLCVRLGLLT